MSAVFKQPKIPKGNAIPIVVIHEFDGACHTELDIYLKFRLGVYVKCIEPSDPGADPVNYSMYTPVREQGQRICDKVTNDPKFSGQFDLLGFSQGAMIARYLIQYCPLQGRIRNFLSFGGPMNGVTACKGEEDDNPLCNTENLSDILLKQFFELRFTPASYWRLPADHDRYLEYSPFLAEANNEVQFNQTLKDGFLALNKAMFVMWEDDKRIVPKESSWWAQFDSDYNLVPRQETEIYKNDLIGIRTLEELGRATFVTVPGDHGTVSLSVLENVLVHFFVN